MSIRDEMRSDWESAEHTGSQLACIIFWAFAWSAWTGLALFAIYAVAVIFGVGVSE